MLNNRLLANKGTKLKIFEDGVEINRSLPKWKNCNTNNVQNENVFYVNTNTFVIPQSVNTSDGPVRVAVTPAEAEEGWGNVKSVDSLEFNSIETATIKELNQFIKDKGLNYLTSKNGTWSSVNNFVGQYLAPVSDTKPETFFSKLKKLFKKEKVKEEDIPQFDAIKFFTLVKLTKEESAEKYVNRMKKYLVALKNATDIGQTALKEKLIRELITNKYESVLSAEGYYYIVNEDQIVDFIKKCENGLSLDYIKNFVRPIPVDVMEKINEVNRLEIFDNFLILHYDPEHEAFNMTAEEEARKRDPIVFGVISGSNKLYYVADWVDEYCNLTLDKFVDTIKIDKEDLKIFKDED